jgi:hypothetical protein
MIGCATPIISVDRVSNNAVYYCIPGIGIESTAFIGDRLIKEGTTITEDALFLKKSFGVKGWSTYHPSGIYKQLGFAGEDTIYQHPDKFMDGWSQINPQIRKTSEGDVYRILNLSEKLLSPSDYEFIDVKSELSGNVEQTLIYTGREGDIVRFTYREFVDNMARSAFTVDVTYDISEDKIIRYKGMSLEIIEIGNQMIKYKLLSGFGK